MESEKRRKIALKRVTSSSSSTSHSTPPSTPLPPALLPSIPFTPTKNYTSLSTSTATSSRPPLPYPPLHPPPNLHIHSSTTPPPTLHLHLLHLNAHLHRLKIKYNNLTQYESDAHIPYRSGKQRSLRQPLKYREVWLLRYSRGIVSLGSTRVLSWDSPCAS